MSAATFTPLLVTLYVFAFRLVRVILAAPAAAASATPRIAENPLFMLSSGRSGRRHFYTNRQADILAPPPLLSDASFPKLPLEFGPAVIDSNSTSVFPVSGTAEQIASVLSLGHYTAFSPPATPLSAADASPYIRGQWMSSAITNPTNIAFTEDPFGSERTALVVNYTSGSYGLQSTSGNSSMPGGTEFRAAGNLSEARLRTALLTYQVAFPEGFDWVMGGKLPGLYAGTFAPGSSCSGGEHGGNCASARLMWRTGGEGEVYAYIPTFPDLCGEDSVTCNDEYGTSFSRGSFTFRAGGNYTTVSLYMALNSAPTVANGHLAVWANEALVLHHSNLILTTQPESTGFAINALFMSTFFGGSTADWASPGAAAYFRDFQVWGSTNASTTPGKIVQASYGGFTPTDTTSAARKTLFSFRIWTMSLLAIATGVS